ncbi:MAG: c-type cytochrome [Gemmatimonadetes bacterium]|nr:c-type cytochrome [Gemmatimonadota bacterium]
MQRGNRPSLGERVARPLAIAVLCATALCLTALARPASAQVFTPLGDPLKGERLFETKGCIRCHRVDGRGGTVGPNLSRLGQQRDLLQLAGLFWNHSPGMSARMQELGITRPVLSGSEMADIMAFLYALNYFDEPGDPVRGARLFREKQCVSCHGSGGPLGGIGPSVERLGDYGSPLLMIQAMWNHGPDMQERMKALEIRPPVFEGSDMADLLAYLRREGKREGLAVPSLVPGDPREGWKLFTVKGCIRCHAVQGEGGKVGPDLSQRRLPQTPSGLAGLLWNHGTRMREIMERLDVPPPTFTGSEVSDLVAYLYFIGFFGPPADAARGRGFFTAKGCVRCHSVNGKGGTVGPDLARSQAVLSPVEAARLMWNHAPLMEARMHELGITWPTLEGNEMADLLAYLASIPGSRSTPR